MRIRASGARVEANCWQEGEQRVYNIEVEADHAYFVSALELLSHNQNPCGAAATKVHKNSNAYVGETHVYRIKGPDGQTVKIGESAQGVRKSDGASIRAESQVRKLNRQSGEVYRSEIRKTFNSKAEARAYETKVIERFRRRYGEDALPGNLTNH